MWTYLGIRRGERRQDLWIWTAVVEERDGLRWRMYEVGGNVRLSCPKLDPHFGHSASCLYTLGFAIAQPAFQPFRSDSRQVYDISTAS